MVSKQLFNRMSIIALVAIILFGAVAFRADAKTYIEHISEESADNDTNYDAPAILYLDSGFVTAWTQEDVALVCKELSTIRSDTATVRQNSDILIYFVVPAVIAAVIAVKFIVWIFRTFVQAPMG